MEDIVKRLREAAELRGAIEWGLDGTCLEAADEIERLRKELAAMQRRYDVANQWGIDAEE